MGRERMENIYEIGLCELTGRGLNFKQPLNVLIQHKHIVARAPLLSHMQMLEKPKRVCINFHSYHLIKGKNNS